MKKRTLKQLCILLVVLWSLPTSYANTPDKLLKRITLGEYWNKTLLNNSKMVVFNKTSGDASEIAKITFRYFNSSDCSGASLGDYSTPDDSPDYPISTDAPFGVTSAGAYYIGNTLLGLSMDSVHSVTAVLKSTINTVPQGNFTGATCGTNPSSCCIAVTCADSACTQSGESIGTQNFTLSMTASIGDPAEGGVIACNTSANLIAPTSDQSTRDRWGLSQTEIGSDAQSDTSGAQNTAAIIAVYGTEKGYAARLCNEYSTTSGYTSGWYLPAKDELHCLYQNKDAIGGFTSSDYWSSTESQANPRTEAWLELFRNGRQADSRKTGRRDVRCVRAFV